MSREKKDPPKCRGCGKTLKWKPWTGKPQPPVDPSTGEPCDCWKSSGGSFGKPKFFNKNDFNKCQYCDTYYITSIGNEEHERIYHSDKTKERGMYKIASKEFE